MSQLSPVSFHEDTIYCLDYQGEPFAPVKPIVENMGMDWASQTAKLKANKERWSVSIIETISPKGIANITTPSLMGGEQKMLCMPVRKLPAFFASISPNKVKPELRPKIIRYQNECDEVLWRYWTQGKAERTSSNPIPAVPVQSADAPITPDQQCTLQAIAKQRITAINDKFNGKGGALYPKLWSKFNNHFRLARYSQLPQSRMTEAIQYLMTVSLDDTKKQLALPMQTQSNLALQAAQLHSRFIVLHSHVYEEMRSITKAMKSLYRELYPELNKETLDANAVKRQDNALQALTDSFLHKANFALTFPDDRMGECIDPFFQLERMIAG